MDIFLGSLSVWTWQSWQKISHNFQSPERLVSDQEWLKNTTYVQWTLRKKNTNTTLSDLLNTDRADPNQLFFTVFEDI